MTSPYLPLSDLKVIELGQLIAGPFCGQPDQPDSPRLDRGAQLLPGDPCRPFP
jgi:hypothetical protein